MGIKNGGTEKGRRRITRRENAQNEKSQTALIINQAVDRIRTGRPVHGGWEFKEPPALRFLYYSPPFLQGSSYFCFQRPIWARYWINCRPWSGFWDDQRLGLWIWDGFSFFSKSHSRLHLFSRAPRVLGVCFSLYQLPLHCLASSHGS